MLRPGGGRKPDRPDPRAPPSRPACAHRAASACRARRRCPGTRGRSWRPRRPPARARPAIAARAPGRACRPAACCGSTRPAGGELAPRVRHPASALWSARRVAATRSTPPALAARHLPGELAGVPRRVPRDKHLGTVPLPGESHIARRRSPMLGVVKVCPVEGLALSLVDRPRVAVPGHLEVGARTRAAQFSASPVATSARPNTACVCLHPQSPTARLSYPRRCP